MGFLKRIEVVGANIIENNQGQILLAKAPKWSNKWTILGGHIDPGETLIGGSIREGQEETGLKLKPVKILRFGEKINPKEFYRSAHFVYFDLVCKVVGGKIKLDKKELSEYKWIKPEEALKMDLPRCHVEKIKNYLDYKNKELEK